MLYGTGQNGKSTLIETLRAALGDYAADTPAETLLGDTKGGPQPELLRLRGTRLVTATETPEGGRMNEVLVKRLTGGDTIAARNLYSNAVVEFRASFKIWLATNHRPTVTDQGKAMWRRLRLVPFTVTIPDEDRDDDLPMKLRDELHGVVAWAVEGAVAWHAEGLGNPSVVQAATEAYREAEDRLGEFIAERCETRADLATPTGLLFLAWKRWCDERSEKPGGQRLFGQRLDEAGFPIHRTKMVRFRVGIGLQSGATGDATVTSLEKVSTQGTGAHPRGTTFPGDAHHASPVTSAEHPHNSDIDRLETKAREQGWPRTKVGAFVLSSGEPAWRTMLDGHAEAIRRGGRSGAAATDRVRDAIIALETGGRR